MIEGTLSRALLAAMLLFAPQVTLAQIPVPQLKARVTDLTATFNAEQRAALEQKLAAFEAKKGSQIAVLIVPTTQPEAVEQYAVRVQETWKLGRKGVDDGVLMVVAKNDRKLWIEVGYGLEGVLPDATAKRIIEEEIVPRFKQGDFPGGVAAGAERIIKVIEGEPLPEPTGKSRRSSREMEDSDFIVIGLIVVTVIVVIVVGGFLCAWLGRFGGSAALAGATGGVAWAITGAAAVGIFLAIIAFILGMVVAPRRGDISSGWSWGAVGRFGGSAVLGGAIGGVGWAITGAAAVGIFLAIIAFILGMVVAPRRGDISSGWSWRAVGRFGGSAVLGGVIGVVVSAITGEAAVGIFFAIVGFILAMGGFSGGSSSGGSGSGGGWSSGGRYSGGGSSSGGGGFSGGGGSSGGGGAGGSW